MALFVMDEWLWADAAGENGEIRQRDTIDLMFAIYEICDRLVIVRGSPFYEKAIHFWRHTNQPCRQFAKFFHELILYNSEKAELLDYGQLRNLPEGLELETQPEDRYLAQAHFVLPQSKVITTDTALKSALQRHSVACEHRDDFISQYLARHRGRKM
jgi:hypothetical protein